MSELTSKLAEAGVPMGATVTHIYRAKRWKAIDAKQGDGAARRQRIRLRKKLRPPIVFDHMMLTSDPRRVQYTPPSPRPSGRAA